MKSLPWIIGLAIIGAAAGYGGYQYGLQNQTDSLDNSASTEVIKPKAILGQGKLQPADGIINVVAQPGERITSLKVGVGDAVKKDQVLAVLASKDLRELELRLAEIQKQEAEAQFEIQKSASEAKLTAAKIAQEEAGAVDDKIENQQLTLVALEKNLATAQRLLKNLLDLKSKPATSDLINQTEIDKQQAVVDNLDAQIEVAKGEVKLARNAAERAKKAAQSQVNLAQKGVDQTPKLLPSASLELAIELANKKLDASVLRSPVDAQVLDITVHEGGAVLQKPVFLLGQTDKMICIAEITDTQMKDVRVGAKATISSEAFGEPIHGSVVKVGNMIGPPSMKDPNPFAAVDRKTGIVKIELDSAANNVAAKFVNLQVDVSIHVNDNPTTN